MGLTKSQNQATQVPFIISGRFSFTMVHGQNFNVELWDFRNFNFSQTQFLFEMQVSFRLHRHKTKSNLELWALQNCKIRQPKFLLEFPVTILLSWCRDKIVMANYGTCVNVKFYKPSSFSIFGQYYFTMAKRYNCNNELW